MQINNLQSDISIVVLGSFIPGKLSPKWLLSNGIITHEEWDAQDEEIMVAPPASRFRLGNSLEWTSDESRIQVRSIDITKSERITNFLIDIFKAIPDITIRAIGINAGLLFTMHNKDDDDNFNNHFANNEFLSSYLTNPMMKSITFEENVNATADSPRKLLVLTRTGAVTYEIQDKAHPENNKTIELPQWSINSNNHFVVTTIAEAIDVVSKAEVLHAEFRDTCKSMFGKI